MDHALQPSGLYLPPKGLLIPTREPRSPKRRLAMDGQFFPGQAPQFLGRGAPTGPSDANYANVSLLMHCNGADGSTTFIDNSQYAHALTAAGPAQIDTAQSVFGGASGLVTGSNGSITTPSHISQSMMTGDFTWEMRVRFTSYNASAIHMLVSFNNGLHYWFVGGGSGLVVGIWDGAAIQSIFVSWTPASNTWYAIAVTKSGNSYRFFVNGTQQGATQTNNVTQANAAATGSIFGQNVNYNNNGWVDEVRITKGVARYTANYTVAAAPFPNR